MPSATADDRPERAEQQRGLEVDGGDLPAPAADRLHRPDLGRLLGDERRHRVRDQHERRQQREHRDHVEELRERVEVGLAGPVARSAHLRQPREAGEARARAVSARRTAAIVASTAAGRVSARRKASDS